MTTFPSALAPASTAFPSAWWSRFRLPLFWLAAFIFGASGAFAASPKDGEKGKFHLEEATISSIQEAILAKKLTARQLVDLYLARIKAYNGTCVEEPEGILGPIKPIAKAGQINALITLNLRPATRKAYGFDDRKARSMTDAVDNRPEMPDALEVADQLDREFAKTGKLVGSLHGVVFAIKDQYDTFDLRTTAGADADYANDRPPHDATFIKRLRAAGAIILAKANLGEYASPMPRSSFGGTTGNPYATDRYPGGSSGGSGAAVGANLVTCAIAEETGASIRTPARHNSSVGFAATQELVSRVGMMNSGLNTRVGPIARTVEDVARILDVIAGYDPKDELTIFALDRMPAQPYLAYAREKSLKGVRIGVLREYMDKRLFTEADVESIEIVERGIEDLRKLGATIVDPGPGGALFQNVLKKYIAEADSALFVRQFPRLFPVGKNGKPTTDHLSTLVKMAFDPSLVPNEPTVRDFGPLVTDGETKYSLNKYLAERGDAKIKTLTDLVTQARFFKDSQFDDRHAAMEKSDQALTLDSVNRLARRFAMQQVIMQCMAEVGVDAVTYPTGNVPAPIIGAPYEPNVNGRNGGSSWNILGQNGFPAITVPAGFTTQVYDRVRDEKAPGGTRLVGPTPAKLPVGIDFLGRPFSEPLLLRIASAYQNATHHRTPPPDFGPLPKEP